MDKTKTLRKALRSKIVDPFEAGDVIRWKSADRYDYAAIKTPVGWFTTSTFRNIYVDQTMDYDELVEVLNRTETSRIEIASAWEPVQ